MEQTNLISSTLAFTCIGSALSCAVFSFFFFIVMRNLGEHFWLKMSRVKFSEKQYRDALREDWLYLGTSIILFVVLALPVLVLTIRRVLLFSETINTWVVIACIFGFGFGWIFCQILLRAGKRTNDILSGDY